MDNEYEIDSFPIDDEQIPAPQEPVVQKKVSPFADSPYVMDFEPQPEEVVETVEPAEKPAKKSSKGFKRFVAAVLVVALVAVGCGLTAFSVNSYWEKQMQALGQDFTQKVEQLQQQIKDNSFTGNGNSVSGSVNTSPDGMTPGQVYAKTHKSVVAVSCIVTRDGGFGQTTQGTSTGSGFIFSEDGYVATNYHVVEGATKITVITYDEQEYTAKLVGHDQANDVAVLKVEAQGLQKVDLGSSDDLIVGDQVVAIGHPLGSETATLTVGYVSAKDQSITTDGSIINMLQTDAAINSGNSGGPLFNMKGEVVGITTAKYSGTTNSGASIESIGFAIPIDDVAAKMRDLIDFGYVTGAYLGVSVMDMNTDVMDAFGFPEGAYVAEVVNGHCAMEAGVRPKEMIIAVGGHKVDSVNGLTRALQKFKGGDTTTVTVWRAGAELVLDITLDEKPAPDKAG